MEFNQMELTKIELIDGNVMTIAPIITLADEIIDQPAKKSEKAWKLFAAQFGKDNKGFNFAEDVSIQDNEQEPFSGEHYEYVSVTDLESIAAIDAKRRKTLNLGIRMVNQDNIALPFGEQIAGSIGYESIDKDVDFDEIDDVYHKTVQHIKDLVEQQRYEQEKQEREAAAEEERRQRELARQQEEQSQQEVEEEEMIETPVEEEIQVTPTPKPVNEMEILEVKLREAIETAVPQVELEVKEETIPQFHGNPVYEDIRKISEQNVHNYEDRIITTLKTRRSIIVDELTRRLLEDLSSRYNDNKRILNFKLPESELFGSFKELSSRYEMTKNNAQANRDEKFAKSIELYKEEKEKFAQDAYQEALREYDRLHEHEPKEQADAFMKNYLSESEAEFERQQEIIKNTANSTYEQRLTMMVPNVLSSHKNEIDQQINGFNETIAEMTNQMRTFYDKEIEALRSKVNEIESARIQDQKELERRVELKVQEETQQAREIKKENESLLDTMKRLNSEKLDIESKLQITESKLESLRQESVIDKDTTINRIKSEKERELETIKSEKERELEALRLELQIQKDKAAILEEQAKNNEDKYFEQIKKTEELNNRVVEKYVSSVNNTPNLFAHHQPIVQEPVAPAAQVSERVPAVQKGMQIEKNNSMAKWALGGFLVLSGILGGAGTMALINDDESSTVQTTDNKSTEVQSTEVQTVQEPTYKGKKVGETIPVEDDKNEDKIVNAKILKIEGNKVTVDYKGEERILD